MAEDDRDLKDRFSQLSETTQIVIKAIRNPDKYVLKPQKEGGGNNFYDQEAKEILMKFIDTSTPLETKEKL